MPPRAVVVTGASTGIGRATVFELVSAGFHVFGTVRRKADVESLRQQFPELVTPFDHGFARRGIGTRYGLTARARAR
ncbi:MAG TPA: SDR family NAD(P)-dependent oxidoreductase [Propionibacteriaceae bacterium]